MFTRALAVLLLTAAPVFAGPNSSTTNSSIFMPTNIETAQSWSCQPRKTCGKIRSCDEALWYLYNCSWGGRLDGDSDGAPCENLCGSNEALVDAQSFLNAGHINAAGNYARIATELALREFCEIKKVQIAYHQLPEKTPASELLTAAKTHSTSKCNCHYDVPLAAIEMYAAILLNQLSHGGVPSVTHHEVQGAINAVDTLLFAVGVVPTGAVRPS